MIDYTWDQIPTLQEIKDKYPNLNHCIFDMDGTLVHSEIAHMTALKRILDKHSSSELSIEEISKEAIGKPDVDTYHVFNKKFKINLEIIEYLELKNKILKEILHEMHISQKLFDPNMLQLISDLNENNWNVAIVTASEDPILQLILDYIGRDSFKFSLSTKDTERSKPHPEPYLKAFQLFGIEDPRKIIIFEDSQTGLRSAISSGGCVNKAEWFNI